MMAILVAIMSSLFLFIGMKLGTVLSNMKWLQKFTFLPGVLLIIIEFGKCGHGWNISFAPFIMRRIMMTVVIGLTGGIASGKVQYLKCFVN